MNDRRRSNVRLVFAAGLMCGWFLSVPAALIAQGSTWSAWTAPSVVFSVAGVMLSVGATWNMVQDDRRRIQTLENTSVAKETFRDVVERVEAAVDSMVSEKTFLATMMAVNQTLTRLTALADAGRLGNRHES